MRLLTALMFAIVTVSIAVQHASADTYKSSNRYRIRSGPGKSSKTIGKTSDTMDVVDTSCPGGWCKVKLSNGNFGYVHKNAFGSSFTSTSSVPTPSSRPALSPDKSYGFNLGWGYESQPNKDGKPFYSRDAHGLANGSYFKDKNKCDMSKNEFPCAPVLGLQADGSLLCTASRTSSQSCIDVSNKNNGIANLQAAIKSCKENSSCEDQKMTESLYSQAALLGAACSGNSTQLCKSLQAKVRESGTSLDVDEINQITKPHLAKTGDMEKNVPPGGDNCEDIENEMKKRAGGEVKPSNNDDVSELSIVRNAAPEWKKVITAFSKRCNTSEAGLYKKFGACSNSYFGGSLRGTEHIDLLLEGKTYSPDKLNQELGNDKYPLSRLESIFCKAGSTQDALKLSRSLYGVQHPDMKEGVVGSLGGPQWLHNCLKRNISMAETSDLSDGVIKGEGTIKRYLQSNVDKELDARKKASETAGEDKCKLVAYDHLNIDEYLSIKPTATNNKSLHGQLVLYQKPHMPGARCMVLKDYGSFKKTDMSTGKLRQTYRAELALPAGKDAFGQTYNYDVKNAEELLERFEGAKVWKCNGNIKDIKVPAPGFSIQ